MSTLHCALENGADLYVNERQKILHYCTRSTEERRRRRRKKKKKEEEEEEERRRRRRRKKNAKSCFFTSCGACVKLCYIAMLYTHSIGNQL